MKMKAIIAALLLSTSLCHAQSGHPCSIGDNTCRSEMPRPPIKTVATLPTCNASLAGTWAVVSDATTPTYNGTLTGGSNVNVPVYCNGTAWTSH